MATSVMPPSSRDSGYPRDAADFTKALLNILEDFAADQNQLRDTHRAVMNTLEDFAEEKQHLEDIKKAVFNILEDLGTEKSKLQDARTRLEQSNRELQDFTSVASHDLQEPLRKVQVFGDRLRTNCRSGMDEQDRDALDRMLNATKRMQSLIRDLLSYAQITRQGRPLAPVDLTRIAQEVLSDLEVRITETGAQVDLGDLPVVDADAVQMRQLLQNLIGNALKFRREGQAPIVRLYADTSDQALAASGFFRLVVEDNGIGFEEKYLDRIFTMFQRLHGRSEYEGTGVGLAICRKIAQRHGGDISARSRPGEGAAFLTALPLRPAPRTPPGHPYDTPPERR